LAICIPFYCGAGTQLTSPLWTRRIGAVETAARAFATGNA
jgi:hypothetical protein